MVLQNWAKGCAVARCAGSLSGIIDRHRGSIRVAGVRRKFLHSPVSPDHRLELVLLGIAGWTCRVGHVILRRAGRLTPTVALVGSAIISSPHWQRSQVG